jgi:hypothetical protein
MPQVPLQNANTLLRRARLRTVRDLRLIGTTRARAKDGEEIDIRIYRKYIDLGFGEEKPGPKRAVGFTGEMMIWRNSKPAPYFQGVHTRKKYFPVDRVPD